MKILVVGPAWVGDMVMAQSLFKALKVKYPNSELDVIAPHWSAEIIDRMPEVDNIVEMPLGHGKLGLLRRYRIGKQLRSARYDQALIIPRSYKAALVPWFAKIPQRIGYEGEFRYGLINDARELDKLLLTQTVQRYVALSLDGSAEEAPSIQFPQLSINKENQQRLIQKFDLQTDSLIAFMPGAEYGPAKCWPLEYFIQLADLLIKQGKKIIILGSKKDIEAGNEISKHKEDVINLCGKTSLKDVVDLLALTSQAVSNDSGLMHVASAVGVSVFGIYGSSDPSCTPPLSKKSKIIQHKIKCSPCLARTCRYKHYECLTKINPETVFKCMKKNEIDLLKQ